MKTLKIIIILWTVYSINIFSQEGLVKSLYPNDTLKSEINYSNNVKQGSAKYFYSNGNLKQELNYTNGKVEGVVKDYFENGNVREVYTIQDGKRNGSASLFDKDGKYLKDLSYEDGRLIQEEAAAEDSSSRILLQSGSGDDKPKEISNKTNSISAPPAVEEIRNKKNLEYLDSADVMPEPAGGITTIMNKLVYPKRAIENEIQGIVKVRAFVDEYGEVTQDEVIKGIGYGCDEAAKITVYYTKFTPGLIKGKPVKVQVVIPIEFKLNKK